MGPPDWLGLDDGHAMGPCAGERTGRTQHDPPPLARRLSGLGNVSALPVLDAGVLVGVITTTDCLLAALAPANRSPSANELRPV